jgi:hypothetical protein
MKAITNRYIYQEKNAKNMCLGKEAYNYDLKEV